MINADGLGGFSLRGLARKLGCQAPSLYEYFGSRDAILTELKALASSQLLKALRQSTARAVSPRGAVESMLLAYINFFIAEPWRLEVIYVASQTARKGSTADLPEGSPYRYFVEGIATLAQSQRMDESRAEAWAFASWSYVHGVVSLRTGFLSPLAAELDGPIRAGIATLLAGMLAEGAD